MRSRTPGATAVLATLGLLFASVAPAPGQAQASLDDACASGAPPAWFLGVVYDSARAWQFVLDVSNFEIFLAHLRETHCIPDAHAKILAFENGFTFSGRTYENATEGALKHNLARFGAAAAQSGRADATLFLFLSSHGIAYPQRACPQGTRAPGSLSFLAPGPGEDGRLLDCELGAALDAAWPAAARALVVVDCSFCGGFSDSLTAGSGTVPDNALPAASGVPAAGRIVVTGCAITTECFGTANGGGVLYRHMRRALELGAAYADGWTSPGFPQAQGLALPARDLEANPRDGRVGASEWFFAAQWSAYELADALGIQQQFRIKYGRGSLADDIPVG